MTSRYKRFRRLLLRWHRRLGAVIAIFLFILAGTGILLNHTGSLQLGQRPLQSDWLLSWYGIEKPALLSYSVKDQWLSHLGGDYVYLNANEVAYCEPPLRGAVSVGGVIAVACRGVLVLLTPGGEVIERIDAVFGLPQVLQGLGLKDKGLALKAGKLWYQVNIDHVSFEPIAEEGEVRLILPAQPPVDIEKALTQQFRGGAISLERLLLDLHSGRLFGLSGVIWMDLVALALIWVAGSGVWVWLTRPGIQKK